MAGLTVNSVVQATAAHFRVPAIDLISMRRTRLLARMRFVIIGLACQYTTQSYTAIGLRLGGRDHSTIYHGRERFSVLLATDAEFADDVAHIRRQLDLSQMVYRLPADDDIPAELRDLVAAARRTVAAHGTRQSTVFTRESDSRAALKEFLAAADALRRALNAFDQARSLSTKPEGENDERSVAG